MDREFQIAMAAEKNARTNAGFQKLLQLGTVVAAKIGSGDPQAGETPLAMLLGEFYKSLRPDQMGNVIQLLDMSQKIMFMEIVNLINPSEQKGGGGPGQSPGGPNGAA